MEIKLYYREKGLGQAWDDYFSKKKNVRLIYGNILDCDTDAIVSPANSFGFMDGGLDYYISEKFGWDLQERLQKEIYCLPEGEILIGKALIIETNDKKVPYLISAPTMRVPMSFNISTSINAYLAMKAILIAATKHERINSVSVPGLCTGVGRMPYDICAIQMFAAYCEIIEKDKKRFSDFGEAQKYQFYLNKNGMIYG